MDLEETQKTPPDLEEGAQGAPPDPVEETQQAPSDLEEDAKDEAGSTAGSTDLGGPVLPARLKLAISGNLPPNNVIAHVESTGAHRCGRSSVFLPTAKEADEESALVCYGGGSMGLQVKVEALEPTARDMSSEQKSGSRRWIRQRRKSGGKLGEKKKCTVDRPIYKLVVGTKNALHEKYPTERRGREVQISTFRLRVLAGRRGELHEDDTFGEGSG